MRAFPSHSIASQTRTSDIRVKNPSERSEWVLDAVASPHTAPKGGRSSPTGEVPAPLPHGEWESARGTPRKDLSTGTAVDKVNSPAKVSSLDKYASSVSPHDGDKDVEPGFGKKERHRLRRSSGRLLQNERVHTCGQRATSQVVTLHHENETSHFGGIETCGSVWHCPVCAAKITEGRREELDALLKAHKEAGGFAYMATFTMPHNKFQHPKELKDTVSEAWRKTKAGKKWQQMRDECGWLGDVRALEITHGENGWHPHIHVLILFKSHASDQDANDLAEWLFSTWQKRVFKMGYGLCSRDAFRFDPVSNESGAADYVSKWGASHELTKAHMKKGRGGRTPWQILRSYQDTGSEEDARLFRQYGKAFKGARQLTWSRGLRALYLEEPEKTDEELAVEDQIAATHSASIHNDIFRIIVKQQKTADLLVANEQGGFEAVLQTLTDIGIPWEISEHQGLERGRTVPLITLKGTVGKHGDPFYPSTNVVRKLKWKG
ncbi:protein rep [Terasakiella sp.]|uniref:protein rep n=1 Tax=Terasakiella sp. TaxID=2034861 RepID=UPI003AA82749